MSLFRSYPTVVGTFAVLVWGLSLPVIRFISDQIGNLAYLGILFTGMSLVGFAIRYWQNKPLVPYGVFCNKYIYLRWIPFTVNVLCCTTAVAIVHKNHMPLLILINYLWPTTTILFSILVSCVSVHKWPMFVSGLVIIFASMAIEIMQPNMLGADLLNNLRDCFAYGLALTAALFWGIYSAFTRKFGNETGGSQVIPIFQAGIAVLLPLFSFLPGLPTWQHPSYLLVFIMPIWILVQFCSFLAWDNGMRYGNVVVLSLCADFIPWISLTTAQLLLGVAIGHKTMLSAMLLVAGAMITRQGTSMRPSQTHPSEHLPESLD